MTAWAYLPNAVHIDRVIASAKAHPGHWAAAQIAARGAARGAARDLLIKQGRYSVWLESQEAVWSAGCGVGWDVGWGVAMDALLALIAFDDCAYMLDSDPGELAILAKFGDHRAILLLRACKALHSLKELV